MSDSIPVPNTPIIRTSLSFPVGGRDGAQLIFETYFPQDATKGEIISVIDKVEAVATRQMLKGEIAAKQAQLANSRLQLENMVRDKERVAKRYNELAEAHVSSGRKGAFKLPAQETQQEAVLETSIETTRATIERLIADIEQLTDVVDAELKQAAE